MDRVKRVQKGKQSSKENLRDGDGAQKFGSKESIKLQNSQSNRTDNESKSPKTAATAPNSSKSEESDGESISELKNQLEIVMNSLATLSAEKTRMEAHYQSDKKQLRSEREECEKVIKDLKDKLKRTHGQIQPEVEHLKYKLIMERHEREKEQIDHSAMIKELQRIVNEERKAKEQMELQLRDVKSQGSNKPQSKVLEAELEIVKNKLKQAEAAAKETPSFLLSLQAEMASMKRQHRNAIREEQKRAAVAEQQARALAMTHESRVVGLEARLAELSEFVGSYDRLRQQDQQAIHKLKDQLINMQDNEKEDQCDDPQKIASKIKELYSRLLEADKSTSCANVKDLLNSLHLCDVNQDFGYKQKYEVLLEEFENLKKNNTGNGQHQQRIHVSDRTQLHRAKAHSKNLEERLRMQSLEMSMKEKEFKTNLESLQQAVHEESLKTERLLNQKDSEYRNRIAALEQQLLRQRERSLVVIEEKDHEIQTLKSSFDALVPKKNTPLENEENDRSQSSSRLDGPEIAASNGDLVTGLLTIENNPPMLYYAQELARRDVSVSMLRKQIIELETALRDLQRENFKDEEKHDEELKKLQAQITRLNSCKAREGANLEYLKNVFVNYLTTKDSARKRHMLNAISTVLQLTTDENERIRKLK